MTPTIAGVAVPCVNGTQTWQGYQYPGLITKFPTGTENYTVAGKWQVRQPPAAWETCESLLQLFCLL